MHRHAETCSSWLMEMLRNCAYLNGLLLLEYGREVRQDEADVLLLGALLCDQQHVGQHKGDHVQVDELRGQ